MMKDDAGATRNNIGPWTSLIVPIRPRGMVLAQTVSASGEISVLPSPMRVPLKGPGAIAFTRIPRGANSSASWRTRLRIPAFVVT